MVSLGKLTRNNSSKDGNDGNTPYHKSVRIERIAFLKKRKTL